MMEPACLAWLEGRGPNLVDLHFDIGPGTTRIGRSSACPVVLADPMVSREHAEIRNEAGTFTITDLGSTHGTFVNGQQIQQAALSDGTVIRVGNSQLVFHLGQEPLPTVMVEAGGPQTVAAQPAAPPSSAPSGPPPTPAPTAAPRGTGGKRGWLIGCVIVLVLALCACAVAVAVSIAAGLPFGLDALTGDGSPPYTSEDLALALAAPTVDQRANVLANFGPPDEFDISIVQVESGQVRREAWRYYGYGTRVDFVDGEIIWTIDLEPGPENSIFPAWYDPTAFETGMTLDEAREVLIAASPAGFVPEEVDLSEGGEDLAGGVMLIGDQIMLTFDQGVLVYAETFGVSLEETAQ